MNNELLIKIKNKDRLAQRQVYERFGNKLFAVCKRYLKKDEDAEEALADTFFIVFTKIEQLQNVEVFYAWAKKIAINQCLQKLRKREMLQISIDEVYLEKYLTEETTTSFEKDMMTLLNFLPEGCRTIFNLFAIEGYPHKEIAEMLSISEGTSKSQVNFARKKLQELLQTQQV
jgi:RNA polymerase sigma-70 factor (ECF subfamily)